MQTEQAYAQRLLHAASFLEGLGEGVASLIAVARPRRALLTTSTRAGEQRAVSVRHREPIDWITGLRHLTGLTALDRSRGYGT